MAAIIPVTLLNEQAQAAHNAMAEEARKSAAYNALASIYGPMAGNPQAALALQNYGYNEQANPLRLHAAQQSIDQSNALFPVKLQGLQLSNDTAQQALEHNNALFPEQLRGAQLGNDLHQQTLDQNQELFPAKKAEAIGRANLLGAEAGLYGGKAATDEAVRERVAAAGMISALNNVVSNGGDPVAAFDRLAPSVARMSGVTPEHLAAIRAGLQTDPQGTLNALGQAISAANEQALLAKNPKLAAANSPDALREKVQGMQFTASRVASVPNQIDAALALLDKTSDSAIFRKAAALKPGSASYNLEKALEPISHNLSLDDLRALKQSGFSLGRVTIPEFLAASQAIANLDMGQDKEVIRGYLLRLKAQYQNLSSGMQDDIAALTKRIPGGRGAQPDNLLDKYAPLTDKGDAATGDALVSKYGVK